MEPEPSPFTWQLRAWERDPGRRFVAVAAMLFAGTVGLVFLHHLLFALIGIVVVFVSTAELFLPVVYTLTAEEARQKCGFSVSSIRWADVKRLIPQSDGVRLSPFARPHRLDAFRGLFLRYASNETDVLGKIRALWQYDASALDGKPDTREEEGADREGGASGAQAPHGDASHPLP